MIILMREQTSIPMCYIEIWGEKPRTENIDLYDNFVVYNINGGEWYCQQINNF